MMQPQPMVYDCVVQRKKTAARARVMPLPPEEFGISRYARDIRTSNYCYHKPYVTEDDLIEQGYDAVQVRSLPTLSYTGTIEEVNRDTVAENQYSSDNGYSGSR